MTIEIIKKTSWTDVLNAARFTVRKPMTDKEPSEKFKEQMVMAEHSPLRELVFTIVLHDIPKYVSVHLVRHNIGIEKFVTSSRPDRNGFKRTRHEQRDDDLVDMMLTINAQALINISKVRLCNKAEATTRELWRSIINVLASTEPILAKACVPSCIYRGLCPEISTCHAFETEKYKNWREGYVRGE
jgi:hypothetical protein